MLTDGEQKTVEEARRVWEMACAIYKVPDEFHLTVLFTDNKTISRMGKCRTIGHCRIIGPHGTPTKAEIRFNRLAVFQDLEDTLKDTVPHEIAHVICGIFPDLGDNHDSGWQRVCRRLGGTGEAKSRLATYDLRQRIRWRHRYVVDSGRDTWLSDVAHNRVQSGNSRYRFPDTKEAIEKQHYTGEKK